MFQRNYIKGTSWGLLDRIIVVLESFFSNIIFARSWGIEQYGHYSLIIAIVSILQIVSKMGAEGIAIKTFAIKGNNRLYLQSFLKIAVLGSLFAQILLIIPSFRYTFISGRIYAILVIYFCLHVLEVYRYYLVSVYRMQAYTIVKSIVLMIVFCLFIIGIRKGFILDFYIISKFIGNCIIICIPFFLARTEFTKEDDLKRLDAGNKTFLRVMKASFPLLISGLSIIVYMRIDQVMIQEMMSSEDLGIYSAIIKLSESWFFIPTTICSSLIPYFSRTYQDNRDYFWKSYKKLAIILGFLSTIVSFSLAVLSKKIILVVYGNAYVAGAGIMAMYAISGVFVTLGCIRSIYTTICEYSFFVMMSSVVTAFLNIILNRILIFKYGLWGATMATIIAYVIQGLFSTLIYSNTRRVGYIQLQALISPIIMMRKTFWEKSNEGSSR